MISPKIPDEKRRTVLNYATEFKHESFEEERENREREIISTIYIKAIFREKWNDSRREHCS